LKKYIDDDTIKDRKDEEYLEKCKENLRFFNNRVQDLEDKIFKLTSPKKSNNFM